MATSSRRLFGLPAQQGRWLMIPIGITAMLCLGTVYAWSIFRTPLEQDLGLGATASLLPFTVALVSYSGMMPLAGRRVATMGAVVVALGYMRASAAGSSQELVLAYGVVAGLVFTAYGVGALVGTLITGQLRDWLGTYSAAFYPLAAKLLPGASRS